MWQQIYETSEIAYMKDNARFYLGQLQAMDDLEALNAALARVEALKGHRPTSWSALAARGWLRRVPPADPGGLPYELDPETGRARLSPKSEFFPLPADMPRDESSASAGPSPQAGS
jgi:hypothetical protein